MESAERDIGVYGKNDIAGAVEKAEREGFLVSEETIRGRKDCLNPLWLAIPSYV
jgi:hypothetical protein